MYMRVYAEPTQLAVCHYQYNLYSRQRYVIIAVPTGSFMHVVEFKVYAPYSMSIHVLDIAIIVYTDNLQFLFWVGPLNLICRGTKTLRPAWWPGCLYFTIEGRSPRERKNDSQ